MIKLKHNGRYVTAEGRAITLVHVDHRFTKPNYSKYKFWCAELNCWFTEAGTWRYHTPDYARIVKDLSEDYDWPCWL